MAEPIESALSDWTARVERCFQRAADKHGPTTHVLTHPDARTTEAAQPEWGAFPIRVARCLSRQSALEVLDWRADRGDEGRRRLQEEYLEWRVVRDESGRIQRVEMSTELPDAWCSLAAREPEATLRIIAERAREPSVPAAAVYGELDPFGVGVSPQDRERAFVETTLSWDANNPYNNGQRGICCMAHRTNTLGALIELVARSAFLFVVREVPSEDVRCATAAEAIPRIWDGAQAGRNSDPVLVERLVRLAFEGRLVALAEPIGIYVTGIEHTRLRLPDGSEVPSSWFTPEPGAIAPYLTDGRSGHQRVVFEVPPDETLSVGELIDAATEQPIRHGGQIADLVQLGVPMKTSAPGIVDAEPELLPAAHEQPPIGCEEVLDVFGEYSESLAEGQAGSS